MNPSAKDTIKSKPTYKNVAISACFGTFLEWYDFLTFGSLAFVFGPLFFPSSDQNLGLLFSLATFSVGMFVRPIGSALFGSLGDRIGRKPVFMVTISLMGAATVAVGFLPTYAQIGIWAPILLVVFRLVQGLSAGGEIGGSAVFLAEHAGNCYRGFKTSFLQLTGPLGILASTSLISLLQSHLSIDQFLNWGWRIPFWISLLLLIIAFYARKSIEETPAFLELIARGQMESQLINNFKDKEICKRMFLLFICISSSGAILFFCVQVYTPIFLKASAKLETALVDKLSIISTLTLLPLIICAGWLSDKYGRKPIMLTGIILGAISIYPVFALLQYLGTLYIDYQSPITLFGINAMLIFLSFLLALVVGPQTALIAELFPIKNRNSAAILPHNLAAGWIGGLLPFIVTWLNQVYGSNLAGLWYPTILLICAALITYCFLPETGKTNLNT